MNYFKKSVSLALAVILCFSMAIGGYAVDDKLSSSEWETLWQSEKSNLSLVALTPGGTESEMNFAWLSSLTDAKPSFKIATLPDLSNAISAEVKSNITPAFVRSNKVTASNLEPKKTYYYSYTINGTWQNVQSFRTSGADNGLKALFVSDSQIGRSGDSSKPEVQIADSYGWYSTLYSSINRNDDIDMILSSGDQVELGFSNKQYNSFLAAPMLRNFPLATAIGNHDFYSPLYKYHFNNPNEYLNESMNSPAGYGYWFCNNGVLFIVLNSNNALSVDNESIINRAIAQNPDAQWRVVMMHHSIYSPDSGEKGSIMRTIFAPLFDKYNIDLVLSGHDHMFSRSHPITANTITNSGVVYLAAGCASGSNICYPPENLSSFVASSPANIDAPVYTMLDFNAEHLNIKTFRADTNECIDTYSMESSSSSEALPNIGSVLSRIIGIIVSLIKAI